MEYIAHRINTVKELRELSPDMGAELDLRDDLHGRIYIQHEPYEPGELFTDYIKEYVEKKRNGTLILNIKSERIEFQALKLMKQYQIKNYFFLDSSFPMIHLLSSQGEKNIALRYSEFEGMDTIVNMRGKIRWIWVDCFTKMPLDYETFKCFKEMGYKLCLVSPELQGRAEDISTYKDQIEQLNIVFDSICTKREYIELWK